MPATNNVEHILLTLRTDYPKTSGRQAETLWKSVIADLVNEGSSAVQPLMIKLHARDRAVRKACAQALGKLADPRAIPALNRSSKGLADALPSFAARSMLTNKL